MSLVPVLECARIRGQKLLLPTGPKPSDNSCIDEAGLTHFASEVGKHALLMTNHFIEVDHDGEPIWRSAHRFGLAAASEALGILCNVMSQSAGRYSHREISAFMYP